MCEASAIDRLALRDHLRVRSESEDHVKTGVEKSATKSQGRPRHGAREDEAEPIRFEATLYSLEGQCILRLPEVASKKLPSRGQVAVHGTLQGCALQTVLEPDGDFGHWMRIDAALKKAAGIDSGDSVRVEVTPSQAWPEPSVPPDLKRALADAPQAIRELGEAITPMARWEWVRWVNATKNPATRKRRVEVSLSKLGSGKRRPCCFNLAACTDPDLAKNGKLIGG